MRRPCRAVAVAVVRGICWPPRHGRNWLRPAGLRQENDPMPTERIDRAKIEAGPDRSPERLPKISETVRRDGSGKSVQALSMGDRIVDLNCDALLDRQGAVMTAGLVGSKIPGAARWAA